MTDASTLIEIAKQALLEGAGHPETQVQRRGQEIACELAACRVVSAILNAIEEPSEDRWWLMYNAQCFARRNAVDETMAIWKAGIAALRDLK